MCPRYYKHKTIAHALHRLQPTVPTSFQYVVDAMDKAEAKAVSDARTKYVAVCGHVHTASPSSSVCSQLICLFVPGPPRLPQSTRPQRLLVSRPARHPPTQTRPLLPRAHARA